MDGGARDKGARATRVAAAPKWAAERESSSRRLRPSSGVQVGGSGGARGRTGAWVGGCCGPAGREMQKQLQQRGAEQKQVLEHPQGATTVGSPAGSLDATPACAARDVLFRRRVFVVAFHESQQHW